MKKFISVILLVCVLVGLMSISAYADSSIEVNNESELRVALGDTSKTSIVLKSNITLSSDITINRLVDIFYDGGSITNTDRIKVEPTDTYHGYVGGTGLYLIPGTYNVNNEGYGYHVVNIPPYPTPICNDISDSYKNIVAPRPAPELTVAMQFFADPNAVTWAQFDYYQNWYADFSVTLNKTATFEKAGGDASGVSPEDGYLAGQFLDIGWEIVPFDYMGAITVEADVPFNIMEQFLPMTLLQVYTGVGTFNCGIFFTEEFLAKNPGATVTLSLDMHEAIENGKYVGKTQSLTAKSFEVAPTPPPVPATADNSNMPLWSLLFIGFAAVAVLTAKKKKA